MRVLIVSAGSWGDIAPHTGLAARLTDAGHDVTLATHDRLAPHIRARGLAFRSLGVDISDLFGRSAESGDRDDPGRAGEHGGTGGGRSVGPRSHLANMRQSGALIRHLLAGIAGAMQGGGDGARPDVVLLSATVAPLGWHVAEGLDLPTMGAYLQPATRTGAFPPPFLSGRVSLGRWGNRALTDALHEIIDAAAWPATRRARRELGLAPCSPRALRRRLEAGHWPVAYGYSPTVVPRPGDWRPGLEVTGYWFPPRPAGWRPPDELVDFLGAGPPPVLVTFGSMAAGHGERVSAVARAALRKAGVRGVVQAGLAGLEVDDDDILTVGEVPHDWLMPRCAAVVHHAAAGTTAAGLRAGTPAVPVPVRTDQQFWAHRLTSLGVSPGPQPFRRLSPEGLAAAVRRAVSNPEHRERAAWIAGRLAREDGPGHAVAMVEAAGGGHGRDRTAGGHPVRATTR